MKIYCRECNHIFEGGEEILVYEDEDYSFNFCDCSCLKDYFMSFAHYEVIKVEDNRGDEE